MTAIGVDGGGESGKGSGIHEPVGRPSLGLRVHDGGGRFGAGERRGGDAGEDERPRETAQGRRCRMCSSSPKRGTGTGGAGCAGGIEGALQRQEPDESTPPCVGKLDELGSFPWLWMGTVMRRSHSSLFPPTFIVFSPYTLVAFRPFSPLTNDISGTHILPGTSPSLRPDCGITLLCALCSSPQHAATVSSGVSTVAAADLRYLRRGIPDSSRAYIRPDCATLLLRVLCSSPPRAATVPAAYPPSLPPIFDICLGAFQTPCAHIHICGVPSQRHSCQPFFLVVHFSDPKLLARAGTPPCSQLDGAFLVAGQAGLLEARTIRTTVREREWSRFG
ncbi:hypothetical protein B0H10DRAFT_778223 [Mycena sp. CBHHK59/15]|nr:hypothetical protein B0H10DRAFT_778223 [Mycena sp. CBHHK59/15]